MFFKKKKNPNSNAFANTTPNQPTPQPQAQPQPTNSSTENEITVSQLLEFLNHAKDNDIKAKSYILLAMFYHDGTNGAVKDIDKAVFYAEKATECEEDNHNAHFYAGFYLLEKALKATDGNEDVIKAILRLILAHSKGSEEAYKVLEDVAKSDLFNGVNTADELIELFLKAIKN